MKKAVIVVGSHCVGKSRTINQYFKPMIGLSGRQRNFSHGRVLSQSIEEREGRVLSQTLEEKGLNSVKEFVEKYADLKYLVCAARPDGEKLSFYKELKASLLGLGYQVETVRIIKDQPDSFYEGKAQEIYSFLEIR
ncbi:MAG: hypothetical protein K6L60_06570 [Oceanobacter sp.]